MNIIVPFLVHKNRISYIRETYFPELSGSCLVWLEKLIYFQVYVMDLISFEMCRLFLLSRLHCFFFQLAISLTTNIVVVFSTRWRTIIDNECICSPHDDEKDQWSVNILVVVYSTQGPLTTNIFIICNAKEE